MPRLERRALVGAADLAPCGTNINLRSWRCAIRATRGGVGSGKLLGSRTGGTRCHGEARRHQYEDPRAHLAFPRGTSQPEAEIREYPGLRCCPEWVAMTLSVLSLGRKCPKWVQSILVGVFVVVVLNLHPSRAVEIIAPTKTGLPRRPSESL